MVLCALPLLSELETCSRRKFHSLVTIVSIQTVSALPQALKGVQSWVLSWFLSLHNRLTGLLTGCAGAQPHNSIKAAQSRTISENLQNPAQY